MPWSRSRPLETARCCIASPGPKWCSRAVQPCPRRQTAIVKASMTSEASRSDFIEPSRPRVGRRGPAPRPHTASPLRVQM